MINLSTWFLISKIWFFSAEASLLVIEAAMTLRLTPHARPKADLLGTKTYGTFLSSASRGMCSKMARGAVSAARTTISAIPRLRVLVASLAPWECS
jgi:hypothetical protein